MLFQTLFCSTRDSNAADILFCVCRQSKDLTKEAEYWHKCQRRPPKTQISSNVPIALFAFPDETITYEYLCVSENVCSIKIQALQMFSFFTKACRK